jgi:anti-anti-sigma factor
MKIHLYPKGVYQVLKIEEDVQVISDLSELRFLVEGYLRQGKRHLAVSFADASYIYSGALAVLIDCFKKIKDGKGDLCLIEPKTEIKQAFECLGLDRLMQVYDSEDQLLSQEAE